MYEKKVFLCHLIVHYQYVYTSISTGFWDKLFLSAIFLVCKLLLFFFCYQVEIHAFCLQ